MKSVATPRDQHRKQTNIHTPLVRIMISVVAAVGLSSTSRAAQPTSSAYSHKKHLSGFTRLGITCSDCHSFDIKALEDLPTGSPVKKGWLKADKNLCKICHQPQMNSESQTLCLKCHEEKGLKSNHPLNQEVACLNCHKPQSNSHSSLRTRGGADTCMKCHANQKVAHPRTSQLIQTDRARGLKFEKGKITCLTCHQIHNPSPGGAGSHTPNHKNLLSTRDEVLNFCASCHSQKTPDLFNKYHRLLK